MNEFQRFMNIKAYMNRESHMKNMVIQTEKDDREEFEIRYKDSCASRNKNYSLMGKLKRLRKIKSPTQWMGCKMWLNADEISFILKDDTDRKERRIKEAISEVDGELPSSLGTNKEVVPNNIPIVQIAGFRARLPK